MGTIPDKPPSQLKALYFQWLFETNDYGMTSCPSAGTAENEDRYEGLI